MKEYKAIMAQLAVHNAKLNRIEARATYNEEQNKAIAGLVAETPLKVWQQKVGRGAGKKPTLIIESVVATERTVNAIASRGK